MEIEPLNMKCQAQTILLRTGWSRAQLVFHTAFTSTLSTRVNAVVISRILLQNRAMRKTASCGKRYIAIIVF